MPFTNETEAITYVFESIASTDWRGRGLDEDTRDTTPTARLLELNGLPNKRREYTVITGSKGKGSVAAITAKLLQSLGHTVGLITSPHLTTYRQRFRVNGRMISEGRLVGLINDLQPSIERVKNALKPGAYLSPQGIFLTLALKWFDEQKVTAAVVEVGRGGRFDDNALVPNTLSMFTPIILEHTRYLGDTVERIAWHKAGIIKPHSYAYSLPQSPGVMGVLRAEADKRDATFDWLAAMDMGKYLGPATNGLGQRVEFGRYGVVDLPMLGRYEIDNASLAIWGAGNMHARLPLERPLSHGSPAYVERLRTGLESVKWPGRCQKLQDDPAVYIDGAINTLSAKSFIESVRPLLQAPVVTVLAVPTDRDIAGVYRLFADISDALVLTRSGRNITINFPDAPTARAIAAPFHDDITWADDIAAAIRTATTRAGRGGTVLMAVAQPAVGDAMRHYNLLHETI